MTKMASVLSHKNCSGVDLGTIALWLGHVSENPRNKYLPIDLEAKREALPKARPLTQSKPPLGKMASAAKPDCLVSGASRGGTSIRISCSFRPGRSVPAANTSTLRFDPRG